MARVVMVGGGIVGLTTAMMFGRRGHDVVVLERNPEPPPGAPVDGWASWDRSGVGQFRQGHWFLSRFRQIVAAELPDLLPAFAAAGALESNAMDFMPPTITEGRGREDRDEPHDVVSGRRPVMEAVVAAAAEADPRVEVRRGAGVTGLLAGTEVVTGVPHVEGVRLESGEEVRGDLVVDAGGRRSGLVSWLTDLGSRAPHEESADCGFRYYGRYFRSDDGSLPGPGAAVVDFLDGYASLYLPGDNGTWMLGIETASNDRELYGLTDEAAWTKAARLVPAFAPVLDEEPLTEVESMVGIPDRYRRFVVDGTPVVTGLVAIGDAWACTNPSLGRGVSMGLLQARGVVELADGWLGNGHDAGEFALAVDDWVEREATPYYRHTLAFDADNLARWHRTMAGEPEPAPDPDDAGAAIGAAFGVAAMLDAECFRARMKIGNLLVADPAEAVTGDPAVFERVLNYADVDPGDLGDRTATRADLLAVAGK